MPANSHQDTLREYYTDRALSGVTHECGDHAVRDEIGTVCAECKRRLWTEGDSKVIKCDGCEKEFFTHESLTPLQGLHACDPCLEEIEAFDQELNEMAPIGREAAKIAWAKCHEGLAKFLS